MILFLNKCLLGSMVSLLVNTIFSDQLLAYSFSSSELNKLSDITLRRDLKSFQISNSYLMALLGLRGKLYICDTVFAGVARL